MTSVTLLGSGPLQQPFMHMLLGKCSCDRGIKTEGHQHAPVYTAVDTTAG